MAVYCLVAIINIFIINLFIGSEELDGRLFGMASMVSTHSHRPCLGGGIFLLKLIVKDDNLRGDLWYICDKSCKVHFFQRNGISLSSSFLLHQAFFIKDDYSQSRMYQSVVYKMCYFPPTFLFFICFIFRSLKHLGSNLMVTTNTWIPWIVLEFFRYLKCNWKRPLFQFHS